MYEAQMVKLLGVNTAEELMEEFDFDNDGVLDREEQVDLCSVVQVLVSYIYFVM